MNKVFFEKKGFKKHVAPILLIIVALTLTVSLVVHLKRKSITVIINDHPSKYITYQSTVRQALKSSHVVVGSKDKILPSPDSKISNGENIIIKRAIDVRISVDGKELKIKSSEENVGLLLKAEGIKLSASDKVIPSKAASLTKNMKIDIIRVTSKIALEFQPIDYKEVIKYNKSLANTKRHVVRNGQNGEKQITYRVIYENGKETSRQVVGEKVVKKPTDMIIAQGSYPLMPVSRGGELMEFSKVYRVKATAYWAVRGIGRTYTASGRKAVRNPDGYSTIAVDPKIFPYGTKLFIEGYGFAVAADTGGAMSEKQIDVFFDTLSEARRWGAKYLKVYKLK